MRLPLLEQPGLFTTEVYLSKNPPPLVQPENVLYSGSGEDIGYGRLDMDLAAIMETFSADPPESDGHVAVALHQSLPLTRREAADMRFWHYLGLVRHPGYIAWRYFDSEQGKTNKHRFIGRFDEHALSRLWWFAELSRQEETGYRCTVETAQSSEFVSGVLENLFGGNRALVAALASALFPTGVKPTEAAVRRLFTQTNARLVSVAIDALAPPEIAQLVESIRASL